jgi:hypothetical protein
MDITKDAVDEQPRGIRDDRAGHPISDGFILRQFAR